MLQQTPESRRSYLANAMIALPLEDNLRATVCNTTLYQMINKWSRAGRGPVVTVLGALSAVTIHNNNVTWASAESNSIVWRAGGVGQNIKRSKLSLATTLFCGCFKFVAPIKGKCDGVPAESTITLSFFACSLSRFKLFFFWIFKLWFDVTWNHDDVDVASVSGIHV